MGRFIDDKEFINNNVAELTKNMESQYAIFTPGTPTFTNYFYINKIASSVDSGLRMAESIVGVDSSVKYTLVKNFPLFNIEQMMLELEDTDHGLDSSYEAEGIILPNTVKPTPDDFFSIVYLGKNILFRVSDVKYDTLKNNNYYKISFELKATDDSYYNDFLKRVVETYVCIYRNYGTENKFLVKEETLINVIKIKELYEDISKRYRLLFHDTFNNALVYRGLNNPYGCPVYDPYLSHFCNTQHLFSVDPNDINNIYFYEETKDIFDINYSNNSFYRVLEEKDIDTLQYPDLMLYGYTSPFYQDSIFEYNSDMDVMYIELSTKDNVYGKVVVPYVNEDLVENIISNTQIEDMFLDNVIVLYINSSIKELEKVFSDTKRIDVLNTYDHYIKIPMLMYIIKQFIDFVMVKEQVS